MGRLTRSALPVVLLPALAAVACSTLDIVRAFNTGSHGTIGDPSVTPAADQTRLLSRRIVEEMSGAYFDDGSALSPWFEYAGRQFPDFVRHPFTGPAGSSAVVPQLGVGGRPGTPQTHAAGRPGGDDEARAMVHVPSRAAALLRREGQQREHLQRPRGARRLRRRALAARQERDAARGRQHLGAHAEHRRLPEGGSSRRATRIRSTRPPARPARAPSSGTRSRRSPRRSSQTRFATTLAPASRAGDFTSTAASGASSRSCP